jgi:protein sidekick
MFVTDMGKFKDATEQEVSVESGQAALLDLPAIESHPAPLVTWVTDGETQLYDRKYAVTADNQFVILDASESDQKAYRCVKVYVNSPHYC